ncbi:hypothetical protein J6590_096309 [Homalodisca vitripennis]|nr:hypothetical protein J6590_096309 [Homalodisca vitripennis]
MSQDPTTNMSMPIRNITASPPRGWANLYNDGRPASSDGRSKHLQDGVLKVILGLVLNNKQFVWGQEDSAKNVESRKKK